MTNYGINQTFFCWNLTKTLEARGTLKQRLDCSLEGEVWTQPLGAGLHGDLHEHGFI